MDRVHVLGVPIDSVRQKEAVAIVRKFLEEQSERHVMTPNSEMLVEAAKNRPFREVLQRSALNIPDSQGVVWMSRFLGHPLPERVAGVDMVTMLCAFLSSDHPVFFLGGRPGVAEKAAAVLKLHNPEIRIAGCHAGSPKDDDAPDILRFINEAAPHLLLVAYGAPEQDLWIAKHLKAMPSVRVAMGVGGTFDFLAGTAVRAPRLLRRMGLEWLWRLLRDPKRFRRILNAVIVFPFLVLRSKVTRANFR